MAKDKPPKIRADGELDLRGQSEGSKSRRFASGDGRPRPGRPKGFRDERTIVQAIRNLPVTVTLPNGRRRKINTYDAILMKLRQDALVGNLKAMDMLMKRFDRYEAPTVDKERTADLLAEDELILATARGRGIMPQGDDDEGSSQ